MTTTLATILATIYGRVSPASGQNRAESLDLQDRRCRAYVQAAGLETPETLIFSDEDVSGRKPIVERQGGRAMLHVLEHGVATGPLAKPTPVKHVVVIKLDRLGRNAEDMLWFWRWCDERGITLHIVDLGGQTITSQGFIGKVVFGVLALFAELEVEMIRDRITRKLGDLFDQGLVSGTIPYGFDAVDEAGQPAIMQLLPGKKDKDAHKLRLRWPDGTRLADNADEQQWIRQMAQWRSWGRAFNKIARELNAAGVRTKAGKLNGWQCGNVKGVLTSRHTARLLGASETRQQAAA